MIAGYNESCRHDNIKLQSAEVTDGVCPSGNDLQEVGGLHRPVPSGAFFSGTVKDAFNAGYDLDITL